MTAATPRQRAAFTPARIVALVLIGARVLGLALPPLRLRRRPGLRPDRRARRRPDPRTRATTRPSSGSYAADCGTLVVPENRADPHSRLIALPVTRIRARSAHPAEPIFRLEGGPGITNMQFPGRAGSPTTTTSSSSATAASTARRARLPRGRVGAQALDGLPRPRSRCAPTRHAFRACADRLTGRRASISPATASRSGSTISTPRAQALGYERIDLAQRERRDAHGDDLRLALPEAHPPLGDDRRQPARPLPLGRRRRPASRSERYAALCAKDALPRAGRRTSPPRSTRPRTTFPTAGGSCRSRRATSRSPRSSV